MVKVYAIGYMHGGHASRQTASPGFAPDLHYIPLANLGVTMHNDNDSHGIVASLLVLVSIGWIAAIAYVAWRGWPHISLDLSAKDAATQAAHQAAVLRHAAVSAAIGLLPPLALAFLMRLRSRRQ